MDEPKGLSNKDIAKGKEFLNSFLGLVEIGVRTRWNKLREKKQIKLYISFVSVIGMMMQPAYRELMFEVLKENYEAEVPFGSWKN